MCHRLHCIDSKHFLIILTVKSQFRTSAYRVPYISRVYLCTDVNTSLHVKYSNEELVLDLYRLVQSIYILQSSFFRAGFRFWLLQFLIFAYFLLSLHKISIRSTDKNEMDLKYNKSETYQKIRN